MLEKTMNIAWKNLQENFFLEETSLFYDYLSSREKTHRFDHLPYPEEIAAEFPNPCGWGTGMEDCMLNAGSAMDILTLRKELRGEDNLESALKVLDGIYRCTFSHGNPGFIVRGISPRDRKSCYPNSSRDQFTLAIYGTWRFLRAYPEAPEEEREKAKRIILAVADFCKRRMNPENAWDLGALDGGAAIVSKMWECDLHEVLRLPMIYAAAFEVSGEKLWKAEADRYFARGLEISCTLNPNEYLWDIPLVQMQLSIKMLKETNLYPESEAALTFALDLAARMALRDMKELLESAEKYTGDWCPPHPNWHFSEFMVPWLIKRESDRLLFRGKPFLCAMIRGEYSETLPFLRGFGNYGITLSCAGVRLPAETRRRLTNILEKIDFSVCCSGSMFQLLHSEYLNKKLEEDNLESKNEKIENERFHTHRAPCSNCHHRHPCGNVAAGVE